MATGTQTRYAGPSRRRVPRFTLQAPLDVMVDRTGTADTFPGRSVNLGERGIGLMLAGELAPGDIVHIEVPLPLVAGLMRTRAVVRYQDKLRCGLEFVELSPQQRAAIRDWARNAKVETEFVGNSTAAAKGRVPAIASRGKAAERRKLLVLASIVVVVLLAVTGGAFWYRWNRAWQDLESGLSNQPAAVTEKPQLQVPAEVMQKLLIHRVEPAYPAEARRANLQGIIALDIVVGRDGSVINIRPINGPDVLTRAAMDALRWWKFEPYRVNGEPAVVETTVAVEFKR